MDEGVKVSRFCVHKFIQHYSECGSIDRKAGSGRPSKITTQVKRLLDQQIEKDDETTAYQLHHMFIENGIQISFRTILRCRSSLGWTFQGSAYCQLIREQNKANHLEWCQRYKEDAFEDVIWTDESTI